MVAIPAIRSPFSPWFGLWLLSLIAALGCTALVLGYKSYKLRERLLPRLLPKSGTSPPTNNDRLRFYLFVLLPWLVLYEVILAIGIPPDAISGMSRLEQRLPVLEWTQIIYASTYFLTLLAPVFAKTRSDLRSYSVRALWTMLIAYPAFLLIPLIAPKRPFIPHTLPGRLLLWERTLDSPVAAFPSFHVIWAILAAAVFARRWPRLKGLFYGWAILVAASCVTTSQHSILDVVGGAATVALVVRGSREWLRPAYSIGCIAVIALILTRLWLLAAPPQLIAGLFLILALPACLAIRPHIRLYQWTAVRLPKPESPPAHDRSHLSF